METNSLPGFCSQLRDKLRPLQHLRAQVSSLLLCLHHFSTSRALWCMEAWDTWACVLPALFYSGCYLHAHLQIFPCARRWEDLCDCQTLLSLETLTVVRFLFSPDPTVGDRLNAHELLKWIKTIGASGFKIVVEASSFLALVSPTIVWWNRSWKVVHESQMAYALVDEMPAETNTIKYHAKCLTFQLRQYLLLRFHGRI